MLARCAGSIPLGTEVFLGATAGLRALSVGRANIYKVPTRARAARAGEPATGRGDCRGRRQEATAGDRRGRLRKRGRAPRAARASRRVAVHVRWMG